MKIRHALLSEAWEVAPESTHETLVFETALRVNQSVRVDPGEGGALRADALPAPAAPGSQPLFVILGGVPGSCLPSLAMDIADSLNLPLVNHHAICESLWANAEPTIRADPQVLRDAADLAFREALPRARGAVLYAWWRHPRSQVDIGTPSAWLLDLPGSRVEVDFRCSIDAAASRLRAITPRWADPMRSRWMPDVLEALYVATRLGAMGIGSGPPVQISTEGVVGVPGLVEDIQRAAAAACIRESF